MSTYLKDTFREIKGSLGRFLAIALIIACGVGLFVGVKATAPSMFQTAEQYFTEQALFDLTVVSPIGFDDKDVAAIRTLEEVDKVMPGFSMDVITKKADKESVIKLYSLPKTGMDEVNKPLLIEGKLPEAANECLVSDEPDGYQIGDRIALQPEAGSVIVQDALRNTEFKVVGICKLPQYLNYKYGSTSIGSGAIDAYMVIPFENFISDRYMQVYVTLTCHRQGITAFGEEYEDICAQFSQSLKDLGHKQITITALALEKEIRTGEEELEAGRLEAEAQLSAARSELASASQQINDGRATLENGWIQYNNGMQTLTQQTQAAQIMIDQGKAEYDKGQLALSEKIEQYTAAKAEVNEQLKAARDQLDQGWATYNEAKEIISDLQVSMEADDSVPFVSISLNEIKEMMIISPEILDALMAEFNINSFDEQLPKAFIQAVLDYSCKKLEEKKAFNEQTAGDLEVSENVMTEYNASKTILEALQNRIDSEECVSRAAITFNDIIGRIPDFQEKIEDFIRQFNIEDLNLPIPKDLMQVVLDFCNNILEESLQTLQAGEQAYEEGKAEAEKQFSEAWALIEQGQLELDQAAAQIKAAEQQMLMEKEKAEQELQASRNQLLNAEQELKTAQIQYEAGVAAYHEAAQKAENELTEGRNRINEAKKQLKVVQAGKWMDYDRKDLIHIYASFDSDAHRIDVIANIFPVFFLLVAMLVVVTTMSRMIDEQRLEMGTLKALGYTQGEIIRKYVIYALSACVVGCIMGPIIGTLIFPRVIFNAYVVMYRIPNFSISVPWMMVIASVFVAILSTLCATLFTCWQELRFTTAVLMRPKAPKIGRQIFIEKIPALWNRLTFFRKLTVRNLFRYKGRMVMTVIGIAGCMALVVAGFGLNNAILPIFDLQFNEIYTYDFSMYLKGTYSADELKPITREIQSDSRIAQSAIFNYAETKAYDLEQEETIENVYYFIPENKDQMESMIHLRDPDSQENISLNDEGAIITQKLAELLDVQVGDALFMDIENQKIQVTVSGLSESYLFHYIYLTPAYYQKQTGKELQYNCIYATQSNTLTDRDEFVGDWLKKEPKCATIEFADTLGSQLSDIVNSLQLVTFVLIISAGLLTFIVLYNLTNINISERLREIATIKVLGMTGRETNWYVFRENMVLSVMGILLGCVFGYLLGHFLISSVEVDMCSFYHHIKISSYLIAAVLTMGFTILVNLFLSGRIKQISMVESLKAVE